MTIAPHDAARLIEERHGDPFSLLGLHDVGGKLTLRAFVPGAEAIEMVFGLGSIVWFASISSQFIAEIESAHWNPASTAGASSNCESCKSQKLPPLKCQSQTHLTPTHPRRMPPRRKRPRNE